MLDPGILHPGPALGLTGARHRSRAGSLKRHVQLGNEAAKLLAIFQRIRLSWASPSSGPTVPKTMASITVAAKPRQTMGVVL